MYTIWSECIPVLYLQSNVKLRHGSIGIYSSHTGVNVISQSIINKIIQGKDALQTCFCGD